MVDATLLPPLTHPVHGLDVNALGRWLEAYVDDAVARQQVLIARLPTLTTTDVRLGSYGRVRSVLLSSWLSVKFWQQDLFRDKWWTENLPTLPLAQVGEVRCLHQQQVKFHLIHGPFSQVESSLRVVLRVLNPAACNGAAGNFKPVSAHLLGASMLNAPVQHREFLDFMRVVRNTIHNNGIYASKDGSSTTLSYRGKSYTFVHLNHVEVAYETIFDMIDDALGLFDYVMGHSKVLSVSGTIADPAVVNPG